MKKNVYFRADNYGNNKFATIYCKDGSIKLLYFSPLR